MTEERALYVRDGDAFVATSCTKNSWHPNAQSGGAVLALLGHALEDVPVPTPSSLSRLSVDIVRPVPIGERLWIDQEVSRQGRLIQVVDATVRSSDTVFVRSRALRIRDEELASASLPTPTTDDAAVLAALPRPEALTDAADFPGVAGFLVHGAELRRSTDPDAPGFAWLRLRVPVVAGEDVRTTSRVALPMDCVNLIGMQGLPAGVTAINPDASGHVMRPPAGEWVGLVGDTRFAGAVGHGFSMALLVDADGVFGVASTTQVVQHGT